MHQMQQTVRQMQLKVCLVCAYNLINTRYIVANLANSFLIWYLHLL